MANAGTTAKGRRGYAVSAALLPALEAGLRAAGIEYRVVHAPEGFGGYPRPVFVTDNVKPAGWTRFPRCRGCGGPRAVTAAGDVGDCPSCAAVRDDPARIDGAYLWQVLERMTGVDALGLPQWSCFYGAPSLQEVRERLAAGTLEGIGPERTPLVAEALARWRHRLVEALSADL